MKIAFYISGLGFGHLMRCLALAEEMMRLNRDLVILFKCTQRHAHFAERYLARFMERIVFDEFDYGLKVIFDPKILGIDTDLVRQSAYEWLSNMEVVAFEQSKSIQDVSLIISDIVPEAFKAARINNIPSVGISNFSWYEVCKLFMTEDEIDILYNYYSLADKFLEYPLSTGNEMPFNKRISIGFVSRPINAAKVKVIRNKYKRPKRKLVMLSIGGAMEMPIVNLNDDYDYMCTQGIDLSLVPNSIGIDKNVLDTQNYIAACDAVITKCGWSTIAETILAGKPIFALKSETGGWAEEKYLLHNLEKLPFARVVRLCQLADMTDEWFKDIPPKFENDASEIAKYLLNLTK